MAKHRAQWNWRRYRRLLDEGRGQGVLSDYKPWITIHDLASRGVVSRVQGQTTGRIHHLLSRNETAFFYILDASDRTLDIREQFPLLPVEKTVEIAENAGIRHPRDPSTKYPYVLTSDFVITTAEGLYVRSVKLSSELSKPRVREKLEIERRYWEEKGVDWRIVTERQIDYQKARNLEWIARGRYYPEMLPKGRHAGEISSFFQDYIMSSFLPVNEIARRTEEAFSLEAGLGITTFQYLLLQKQISIDLSKPLDLVSARVCSWEGGAGAWINAYA